MPKPSSRGGWPLALLGPTPIARRLREDFLRATHPQTRTLIIAAPGMDGTAVARAIHQADPSAPLVEIDCAADDPALVERQLLGRGGKANGALEQVDATAALVVARHGTCILRSVEELSHRAQARLARALRDGEVRVRAAGHMPVACRVIAIGNSTVDADENGGHLRADLRRRLGSIRLELPSLGARREDIPVIVVALMARSSAERRIPPRRFTHAAMALITALQWPDNVSGLSVFVESLVDRSSQPVRVEEVLAYLGAPAQGSIVPQGSLREARRQFERDYIAAVLRRFDGRVAAAARALGIQRTNLYRKARQLGISSAGRVT
ncbi:MAG: sigma-54-dependent transcriptional regulator [Acidobacteriota bacterium]